MAGRRRYRVVVTERAKEEIRLEAGWWRQRGFKVQRIAVALRETYRVLSGTPHIGQERADGTRALALPSIGYVVFFRVDDVSRQVMIRAFWHMSQEHEPDLS